MARPRSHPASPPKPPAVRCLGGRLDQGDAAGRGPADVPAALHGRRARCSPGAFISHETAAALWRQSGWLPARHVCALYGVPVTNMARTVFDLAGVVHPARAERALDYALAPRLTTLGALRAVTGELGEHGRPGRDLMRRLLRDRTGDYVAPGSGLEARFLSVVRAAGLPVPVPARHGGEERVGRVGLPRPRAAPGDRGR